MLLVSLFFVVAAAEQQWPKVSVITPTCVDRHFMHASLYASFASQTYPGDLELVVVDGECKRSKSYMQHLPESTVLTEAAQKDNRIKYMVERSPTAITIGAKRTMAAEQATGEIIAHFDDDDFYSPTYLQTMVKELQDSGADLVKLNSWVSYGDSRKGVDHHERELVHIDYHKSYLQYGFGFTTVFKKAILSKVPYESVSEREDVMFIQKVMKFDELMPGGSRKRPFKVHIFKPEDQCLVLRIVCNGVHRFAGMPDPEHLAKGVMMMLDEDSFVDKCEGDLDPYFELVDYLHLLEEEQALAEFAESQKDAVPREVSDDEPLSPKPTHPRHDEL